MARASDAPVEDRVLGGEMRAFHPLQERILLQGMEGTLRSAQGSTIYRRGGAMLQVQGGTQNVALST